MDTNDTTTDVVERHMVTKPVELTRNAARFIHSTLVTELLTKKGKDTGEISHYEKFVAEAKLNVANIERVYPEAAEFRTTAESIKSAVDTINRLMGSGHVTLDGGDDKPERKIGFTGPAVLMPESDKTH